MIGSHSCFEEGIPMPFVSILDSVTEANALLNAVKASGDNAKSELEGGDR